MAVLLADQGSDQRTLPSAGSRQRIPARVPVATHKRLSKENGTHELYSGPPLKPLLVQTVLPVCLSRATTHWAPPGLTMARLPRMRIDSA